MIPALSAAILYVLISTLSTANPPSVSQWGVGERGRAPYWMVLIVAVGIQLSQFIAMVAAPGAIGLAISLGGVPVFLLILLRKVWDMPWKNAALITVLWLIADVVLQVFAARFSDQVTSMQ